eukprot:644597-Pelagomonas_calceolata.AAC.8
MVKSYLASLLHVCNKGPYQHGTTGRVCWVGQGSWAGILPEAGKPACYAACPKLATKNNHVHIISLNWSSTKKDFIIAAEVLRKHSTSMHLHLIPQYQTRGRSLPAAMYMACLQEGSFSTSPHISASSSLYANCARFCMWANLHAKSVPQLFASRPPDQASPEDNSNSAACWMDYV